MPIFCPAIADSSIGMGLSQARHRDAARRPHRRHRRHHRVGEHRHPPAARRPRSCSAAARRRTSSIRPACRRSSSTTASAATSTRCRSSPTCRTSAARRGSSLEEAQSWGKLATDAEQVTVHADATLALPLLVTALDDHAAGDCSPRASRCAFDPSGPAMAVERHAASRRRASRSR